jgi:hypothetical protein
VLFGELSGAKRAERDQPASLRLAVQASHRLLYGLMAALPLFGWGMLSAAAYSVVLIGAVQLPPMLPHSDFLCSVLRPLHTALALVVLGAFCCCPDGRHDFQGWGVPEHAILAALTMMPSGTQFAFLANRGDLHCRRLHDPRAGCRHPGVRTTLTRSPAHQGVISTRL